MSRISGRHNPPHEVGFHQARRQKIFAGRLIGERDNFYRPYEIRETWISEES